MLMRSRFDGLELISRVIIVLDDSRYSRLVFLTRDVFESRLLLLRERRVREDRDNSRTIRCDSQLVLNSAFREERSQ